VTAAEFESWLQGTGVLHGDKSVDGSPAHQGRQLFLKLNCIKCHTAKADSQAPNLEGLFGRKEKLRGGEAVVVDEAYVVESIRKPRAKVVDGWEPIMPAYEKDVVSEKEVQALVAYIKSLKPGDAKAKEERFPPPVGAPTEPRREIAPPPREKPGG
jgi:cytochrome c oxidase subunit 2